VQVRNSSSIFLALILMLTRVIFLRTPSKTPRAPRT
jgi:hypothetical protein